MSSGWQAFVKQAVEGSPDEPFMAMLRRQLASGSKVMRIHLDLDGKSAEYRILLERLKQLSEMRVPHSASFTRWSLDAGARLASADEEAQRFALVARERFEPIAQELGRDYADAILLERVRALGPPRTAALLSNERTSPTAPGQAQARAVKMVDAWLRSLAADLGKALHYTDVETASILDGALERLSMASRQAAPQRDGSSGAGAAP